MFIEFVLLVYKNVYVGWKSQLMTIIITINIANAITLSHRTIII